MTRTESTARTISDTLNTRALEMLSATILFGWGMVLHLEPAVFTMNPNFSYISRNVGATFFGAVCLGAGVGRWIALLFNGLVRQTPVVRLVGCSVGFTVWCGVTVGLILATSEAGVTTTGLAVYPALAAFECLAAAVCGIDAWRYDSLGIRERAWLRKRLGRGDAIRQDS